MSEKIPSCPRIPFFDNLRNLIIVSVVVVHAGSAYTNLVPLWPMLDETRSRVFDIFILIWDVFGIPVLYFIAGYFALPALQRKKSAGLFLKSKFKHLGIPFILFLFFVLPVVFYLVKTPGSEKVSTSLLDYWIQFVLMATNFKIGYFSPKDIFDQGHLWFVSLLIFFFVLFALAYQLKSKLKTDEPESSEIKSPPSARAFYLTVFFVGLVTAFGSILVSHFFDDSVRINIGNILYFQPVKFPVFFGYFIFGIYAYSRNWFVQTELPGPIVNWLAACIVLSLAFLGTRSAFIKAGPPISLQMTIIIYTLSSFLCLSFLLFLIKFTARHWNSSSKFNQSFSSNSFYIYLIHIPFVLILQFLFLEWDISIFVKFGIVSVVSIALSYAISQYLINRTPRLSIALLLSGFVLFLVFLAP